MTPATKPTPPTPEKIDEIIAAHEKLEKAADEAQKLVDASELKLIATVQAHGFHPEGAPQSVRLDGVHSFAMVTRGVTRSLNEKAVVALCKYMNDMAISRYFRRMFERSVKYTLIDGARDALNGVTLDKTTREKVLQYFGACIEVKTQKPKLTVKAVKPKAAKKPRVSTAKGKAVA